MEQYGGIDILVSNAAVNPFVGNMLDSTEEVWDKVNATTAKLQDSFFNWNSGSVHILSHYINQLYCIL